MTLIGADACSAVVTLCWGDPPTADLPLTPQAYASAYPKHCPDCEGTGWHTTPSSWDGPEETDYCAYCYGDGRCPRCSHRWRRYTREHIWTDFSGKQHTIVTYEYGPTFSRMREGGAPCPHCGYSWLARYGAGGRALKDQPTRYYYPDTDQYGPWRVQGLCRFTGKLSGWLQVELYQYNSGQQNAFWIPPEELSTPAANKLAQDTVYFSLLGHMRPVIWLEDKGTRSTPAGEIFWWEPTRFQLIPRDHAELAE